MEVSSSLISDESKSSDSITLAFIGVDVFGCNGGSWSVGSRLH